MIGVKGDLPTANRVRASAVGFRQKQVLGIPCMRPTGDLLTANRVRASAVGFRQKQVLGIPCMRPTSDLLTANRVRASIRCKYQGGMK